MRHPLIVEFRGQTVEIDYNFPWQLQGDAEWDFDEIGMERADLNVTADEDAAIIAAIHEHRFDQSCCQ